MEGMQQQETNAALNSKRQRRPSVRLGEIGDVPLALFLENRPPLKRRKKRTVAVPTPPSAAEDGDGRNGIVTMDAAEFEMDDDPTAVDMTGFSLNDSTRLEAWPKTKPLEQVVSTATITIDEVEAEFLADTVDGSDQVDEPKLQECDDASKDDDEAGINSFDQSNKNGRHGLGKNGPRKGKRKQGGGAAARNWRFRKAAAEEAVRKARTKKVAEACLSKDIPEEPTELGSENGVVLRNEDEEANEKEELDNKQKSDLEKEADDQKQHEAVEEELLLLAGEGKEDDPVQENELRDSLDSEQGAIPVAATRDLIEMINVTKQHDQCDDSFVLPGSVKRWLQERKLGKYSDLFEYHEVDDEVLPLLTMEDLREMGIHAVGSRRKMLNAIQGLSTNNNKQGVD